jgi:hypothetical protein
MSQTLTNCPDEVSVEVKPNRRTVVVLYSTRTSNTITSPPGNFPFSPTDAMNTVHGMIAFLRAEADLAEARAKQLRLTAALIQSNQELPSTEQRTYRIACDDLE